MDRVAGGRTRTAVRRRWQHRFKESSTASSCEPADVRAFSSGSTTAAHRARSGVMGKAYLVGPGPGDPELLTVKAARLLARAGIVFHDSLVSREGLQLIAHDPGVIDRGKRCGQKLLTQEEVNSPLGSARPDH